MRFAIALAALVLSVPAFASEPAPATAKFTLDTPIEAIVADPAAKAVLDANLPGTSTHAQYEMFKGMSLKQVQPFAAEQLTDARLAKTAEALAAIK